MENRVIVIAIIVVVAAICILVGYLAVRHVKRNTEDPADGENREKASAFIQSVRDTGWYENDRPQMEFELLVFPPDGPPRVVKTRQTVSFSFLTVLGPGKYVDVAYDAGSFKGGCIEGLKRFEVTGEPFDMKYFDDIAEKLKGCSKFTEGTVLSLEETGSFVDAIPIYKVKARFISAENTPTDAETFRVCRPWMLHLLRSGKPVKIVYCESDPSVFSVIE